MKNRRKHTGIELCLMYGRDEARKIVADMYAQGAITKVEQKNYLNQIMKQSERNEHKVEKNIETMKGNPVIQMCMSMKKVIFQMGATEEMAKAAVDNFKGIYQFPV